MISSSQSKLGWRGRWIAWRNRRLADANFQRFAVRTPVLRWIARRRARRLFDLVAGFVYSQILAACIEVRLLEAVAETPLTTDEVAERSGLATGAADRLLRGAAALRLVERLGDRWVLGSEGASLLGNPGITAMVAHHHRLYADLAHPAGLLRRNGGGGELSAFWPYAEGAVADDERTAEYSALMAASQPLIAGQILDSYPFGGHRRILDIGGGEGAFVSNLAARHPQAQIGLFDLPGVTERALARLDSVGLSDQVTVLPGDFRQDQLPRGYDLITLVRVLHDHDDRPALDLLRAIHAALPEGGRVLIAEPMAETAGAEPSGDAYFGFYLLAMGSGRPRSARAIMSMLTTAGFRRVRECRTALPMTVRMIVASK